MAFNAHGQMNTPKSEMPLNYGRVVFVRQGNQINANTMRV